MEEKGSILDKIISSKQITDMEQFNPSESVSLLLKELSTKEEDILRRRFALNGDREQTLEEIGRQYRVTRERIRQIENTAIAKIKRLKLFNGIIHPIEILVIGIITNHGGIIEAQSLLDKLLSYSGASDVNLRSVRFIIKELLKDKIEPVESDFDFKKAWKIKNAGLDMMREIVKRIEGLIGSIGKPIDSNGLIAKFNESEFCKSNSSRINDDVVISAMDLGKRLGKNPYGEYGLIEWGSIEPKRMNDKIMLILRKNGKPMHFTDISKKINEAGFDERKAYPPTVHNELILNPEYVLVGRGIYALREWGYHDGVVADVLEKIIKEAGRPMNRESLVSAVLKQRMVKRNTIHLALTNHAKFKKLESGEYTLVDGNLNETQKENKLSANE